MIRKNIIPVFIVLFTAGMIASCSSTSSVLDNAESAIKSQDYDSAKTAASQYIQQNPQSPMGYYWKGIALGQQAQDKSKKMPAQATPLYQNMQEAFSSAEQKANSSSKKPGELQRIDPFKLSLWRSEHNQAVKYASDDSLKKATENPLDVAIAHLNNATIIEPDSALSWGVLAQVNGMKQNYGEAAKAQQKFVQLKDSVDAKAYMLLAQYYQRNDQPKKAISTLEDVQKKHPENKQVIEILADSYNDAGQSDKAISLVEQLVKQDPSNTHYRLFLGNRIYQGAMKYQNSFDDNTDKIFDLKQKLKNASGSDSQDIKSQIADLEQKNEQLLKKNNAMTDRAIKQLNQVTQKDPSNASAFNTLGIIYQNKASVFFQKRSLSNDNEEVKSLDEKGKAQLQKSMTNYEKAAHLKPDNKKYWESLFQVYTALGMDQKAKEAEKKAGMQ